jgi:RNA polymerase sigma-70 factor, ECF subfamily
MSDHPEPTSTEDDRELMALIARRDEAAFQELFRRYQTVVYSLGRRILGQDHDAADVTSDVFWELWQRPDRYCPSKSAPSTYIIMLTRCRAIDRKRKLSRDRTHAILDWMAEEPPTGSLSSAGPSDELASREQRQLVQQAIGALDAKHREAIELAFFDGMTHQETATKTGVPLGTIKGRIRRALEQIRNHLHVDLRD